MFGHMRTHEGHRARFEGRPSGRRGLGRLLVLGLLAAVAVRAIAGHHAGHARQQAWHA
ncbi:MAG: hypothetical protein K1X87_02195 [Dehalococcoidia bacterium]|nr:hypothetical protein [Dehalococcoidia bacterium]